MPEKKFTTSTAFTTGGFEKKKKKFPLKILLFVHNVELFFMPV